MTVEISKTTAHAVLAPPPDAVAVSKFTVYVVTRTAAPSAAAGSLSLVVATSG